MSPPLPYYRLSYNDDYDRIEKKIYSFFIANIIWITMNHASDVVFFDFFYSYTALYEVKAVISCLDTEMKKNNNNKKNPVHGFNFFYDIISYHDEEIKKRKRFHILHQIILLLGHLKPLLLNRLIISLPFIHIFVTLINSIDESINRSWSNHFLNNSCVYLIIFFANKQTKI
ncbi:hypothetical protein DERF_003284 [Dermatophagoides farinae]|uniref:Uncharacterized protein n=1 Tax=Dermatophagoides farinae TaxID=6954 RepID=A0A922IH31_DERFA|nr:hypothetical protein DERF_003284 [Dermatophagoides farinae]